MDSKTSSCIEAKLKISKFVDSYEKSSPLLLSSKYLLDQLDVLDSIEEALIIGFFELEPELMSQCDQLATKMWRNTIYPQIDYIRRLLATSKDENDCRSLANQLDTVILSHLGRIGHVIAELTAGKREKFDSDAFLMNEFVDNQRQLLVKLFTFSGDLSTLESTLCVRYRSSNNSTFNSFDLFQSSKEFYELAHRIDPSDGSIFNQLAVIESLSSNKSIPMMIYLYSRALGSIKPFPIAKENLSRLLKKFGGMFNAFLCILDGFEPSISSLEEMMKNYQKEEHLLYTSALALGKYSNVPIPQMDQIRITDTENTDMKFLSTLIGSSFIEDSVQVELLKLFNPEEIPEQQSSSLKLPSQHEPVQLPLSQSQ